MRQMAVWLAGLWWASLCTVGFLVVPMLFLHLPTPAMAGGMAAKLFSAQNAVSTACALLLLVLMSANLRLSGHWRDGLNRQMKSLVWVLAALAGAWSVEFVVAPHILAGNNMKMWHTMGSGLYLAQCVCTAVVFWRSMSAQSVTATPQGS